MTKPRKPRKRTTDEFSTRHCVWVVVGIDGSLISEAYWHRVHADEYCPDGCHVRRYWLHLARAPGRSLAKPAKERK